MCNCSSGKIGYDWLISDKEWSHGSDVANNQRLTYSVCTSCILSDNTEVRSMGAALANNLTIHRVSTPLKTTRILILSSNPKQN